MRLLSVESHDIVEERQQERHSAHFARSVRCVNTEINAKNVLRPFCRTVTLHKASSGLTGFGFQNGVIKCIAKDSSAARNGLLTDHAILEVNS